MYNSSRTHQHATPPNCHANAAIDKSRCISFKPQPYLGTSESQKHANSASTTAQLQHLCACPAAAAAAVAPCLQLQQPQQQEV
jgi:hypothetical protein